MSEITTNVDLQSLMIDSFKSKKYVDCLYYANRILSADPSNANAKSYYAKSLYELFSYDTIINYLQDSINQFVDVDDYLYLALSYYSIGDYQSAVKYLQELLTINPMHYDANIYAGLCYKTDGLFDFDKAEQYFFNAVKADKQKTAAYTELIDLYTNNYVSQEKQNQLMDLIEQNIDNPNIAELLVGYAYKIGNYNKVIQYSEKLIDYININPKTYLTRAFAYFYTDNLEKAKDDAKTVLQLDSNNQDAKTLLLMIANADASTSTNQDLDFLVGVANEFINNNNTDNLFEKLTALNFAISNSFTNKQYDKVLEYIDIWQKFAQLPLDLLFKKVDCLVNLQKIDDAIAILSNLDASADDLLLKINAKQKLMMLYA